MGRQYNTTSPRWPPLGVGWGLEKRVMSVLDNHITDYWHKYYAVDYCILCGNRGIIDTTGVTTAAGKEVGRRNYCICPNGQSIRAQSHPIQQPDTSRKPHQDNTDDETRDDA